MNKLVSPKNIYYGKESLNQIGVILDDLKIKNVFLLTDPVLVELGSVKPIIEIFDNKKVSYYIEIDVEAEPSVINGDRIIKKVREGKYDLIIGLGGGSCLDLTKIAAVLSQNEGNINDYLNLTGTKVLKKEGIPSILIPTTAGTGSEVTDIAVFSLEETKDVISHPFLLSDYVIVDFSLTYTLPNKITASSGIDALTHAIESYTSKFASPITDLLALKAIKLISENIMEAVHNGSDKKARGNMALGSLLAGISFYNAGVAGVHGLSYPLGGLHKIPHGESNALLLPYVYDNIWSHCGDKMYDIAEMMGIQTVNMSQNEVSKIVVKSLYELIKSVNLNTTLKDYGIGRSSIPELVKNAEKQTRLLARSPKMLDKKAIEEIYINSYNGNINL